jgi:predicted DNA-binding transcriptional regulator AlpA
MGIGYSRPAKPAARRPNVKQETGPRTGGEELLTLDQVLAELGDVARSTFFRWKALGIAPKTIKLPNGSLRVRRSDLEAWIAAHEEHPAA